MQIFPLPKKILRHIESLCRVFLWTGRDAPSKRAPVAWDHMCDPNNAGGLGITSLIEWNTASIAKLLRNIHSKADKLWVKWVDMYFLKGQSVMEYQPSNSCSWIFKGILKSRVVSSTAVWADSMRTGKYSTGSMYKELRGDKLPIEWRKFFILI